MRTLPEPGWMNRPQFHGIDTLCFLKSGAGVSPAADSTPQVDDFPPHP